jgi:aspartyl-tRNA(Asn)/glutamyl-tRNA(Gln) amidotransferase subunit A
VGVITKSVEDAAIVLSVVHGEDRKDATTAPSMEKSFEGYLSGDINGKRIGIVKGHLDGLSEDIKNRFQEAIIKFEKLGAEIKEIEIPSSKYSLSAYYVINFSEISSNLARFDGIRYGLSVDDQKDSGMGNLLETYLDTRRVGLGDEVKRRVMLGTYALSAGYYDAYYKKAQKVRGLIKKDFEEAFKSVDFIFSPTAPEVAFKIGEKSTDPLKMYLSDIYTISANMTGVPAISFPIGTVSEDGKNLPVGGQLMAKWFDEEGLLNAAHTFEVN